MPTETEIREVPPNWYRLPLAVVAPDGSVLPVYGPQSYLPQPQYLQPDGSYGPRPCYLPG